MVIILKPTFSIYFAGSEYLILFKKKLTIYWNIQKRDREYAVWLNSRRIPL